MNQDKFKSVSLRNETVREKCPKTEFFLVRIFPYLNWIWSRKSSVFGHFSRWEMFQDKKKIKKTWKEFSQFKWNIKSLLNNKDTRWNKNLLALISERPCKVKINQSKKYGFYALNPKYKNVSTEIKSKIGTYTNPNLVIGNSLW